jgi:pyrroline-5-carboxylate reductase
MKITFIGGGNMALALIGGMRKQGFSAAAIQVVEPFEESRERLTETFGVRCTPTVDAAALNCEVLVLAVKPQQLQGCGRTVPRQARNAAGGEHCRRTAHGRYLALAGQLQQLVRTMPNTPALIGAGVTGLCADPSVDLEGRTATRRKSSRRSAARSGSKTRNRWTRSPRFPAAVPPTYSTSSKRWKLRPCNLGFDARSARQLTVETFLGAARLAEQSPESLSTLA